MKFKTRRIVLRYYPFRFLITWMKKVRFRRQNNASLYTIIRIFLRDLFDKDIIDKANGVAFNFILAIFPAIIFLFTLIPFVSTLFPAITKDSIMLFFQEQLPASMFEVIKSTVLDIISNQRGGLLSLGFVFSIYLSTNGTLALIRAFNSIYRTRENRTALRTRLIATGLTFNLAFVVFLSILLLIVGQLVLDYLMTNLPEFRWLNRDTFTVSLIFILRFLVIFIAFFLAISALYYFGPAIHYNWRFFSIGSFLATLFTLLVSYGFSYYVTNFGTYNKVYGSIGVLIAMMAWIQLVTIVLLVCYNLNASIHNAAYFHGMNDHKRKVEA